MFSISPWTSIIRVLSRHISLVVFAVAVGTTFATGQTQTIQITGTLTFQERIGLAKDATIHIRLKDATTKEERSATVAEQTIVSDHNQPPIRFALTVPVGAVHQDRKYLLGADVEMAGRIWLSGSKPLRQPPLRSVRNITILLEPSK